MKRNKQTNDKARSVRGKGRRRDLQTHSHKTKRGEDGIEIGEREKKRDGVHMLDKNVPNKHRGHKTVLKQVRSLKYGTREKMKGLNQG